MNVCLAEITYLQLHCLYKICARQLFDHQLILVEHAYENVPKTSNREAELCLPIGETGEDTNRARAGHLGVAVLQLFQKATSWQKSRLK